MDKLNCKMLILRVTMIMTGKSLLVENRMSSDRTSGTERIRTKKDRVRGTVNKNKKNVRYYGVLLKPQY